MAPPYVTEIALLEVNDAYKSNPDLAKEMLDYLASIDGSQKIYYGLDLDNPDHWWLIIEWTTLEAHHKFMNDKAAYGLLAQKSGKFAKGLVRMFHVNLVDDASRAFSAPVTEIDIWTLKSDHHTDEKRKRATEIVKGVSTTYNGLTQASGVYPGSAGPVVEEDQHVAVLVAGWTSKEQRNDSLSRISEKRVLEGELSEFAKEETIFVKLSQSK
ncbi:hypothetical protein K474DRAFT_1669766 [Panus rudis PR-1116 ss-1]|nr:hypothetical protein K474DRAFT_1669766 [Panus rudis PR-1116 ss-1]